MLKAFPRIYLVLFVFAALLAASALLLNSRSTPSKQSAGEAQTRHADAAFRDGLFLGKLHAESGRPSHLSVGRWNTAKDRAAFTAGYRQSYQDVEARAHKVLIPEKPVSPNATSLAAYGVAF